MVDVRWEANTAAYELFIIFVEQCIKVPFESRQMTLRSIRKIIELSFIMFNMQTIKYSRTKFLKNIHTLMIGIRWA